MSLSQQTADLQKIEATIKAGRDKIAAVDADLRPEIKQARIAAIRTEAAAKAQAIAAEMATRAKAARDGITFWSQDAVRRRAKFAEDAATDAVQRSAYFQTISRAPTGVLIEYLKDALREKNLAKVEATRLEFHSRADTEKFATSFGTEFERAFDPHAEEMTKELKQIAGVAEFANVRLREFVSDRPDPAARIAAGRAAGMVKLAAAPDQTERAAALTR